MQELLVRGERVQLDQIYDTTFVTSQGAPAKYGTDRRALDIDAIEALRRYWPGMI